MTYPDALSNCAKQTCVGQKISELNFISYPLHFMDLGSFLGSIEHDFIKLSKIRTDNHMFTVSKTSEQITRGPAWVLFPLETIYFC